MIQKSLEIIRPCQLIILVIIIGLEIVQLVGFANTRDQPIFPNVINFDSSPASIPKVLWSVYFEDMNVVHGVKIFYFIVILLTLVCPQFFWKKFNRVKVLSRDRYYEYFYLILWFAASFSNLKPVFDQTNLNCGDKLWGSQGYRCRAFLSSVFFSFLMSLTWLVTTVLVLTYIHEHHGELDDEKDEKAKKDEINKDDDDDDSIPV